jgi:hypothetical protein
MSDISFRERGPANGVDRAIKLSTAGAVLAVACIAAYISYWHAYAVVREFGESGLTARMEPATIDGLVYACSMVMLYAAWHQRPVPALARWLLALGIAATLAANMAQGLSHGAGGAMVAAWPAASLVGSYELLVWIIRTSATIRPARVPDEEYAGQPTGHAEPAGRTNAGSRATARVEEISSGPSDWTGRTTAVPAGQDRGPGGRSHGGGRYSRCPPEHRCRSRQRLPGQRAGGQAIVRAEAGGQIRENVSAVGAEPDGRSEGKRTGLPAPASTARTGPSRVAVTARVGSVRSTIQKYTGLSIQKA